MTEWTTFDYHIGGEAVRVFLPGRLDLPGRTMTEKREALKKVSLVQLTICEPRGHSGMYAAVLTEPVNTGSAFGVLFACNDHGFPLFCGHAMLGAVQCACEKGVTECHEGENRFQVDTPSQTVEAHVTVRGGKIVRTAFVSLPCFVMEKDLPVQTEHFGEVTVSLVWSGSFMTFVSAEVLGEPLSTDVIPKALAFGTEIDRVLKAHEPVFTSPYDPALRLRDTGSLVCFVTPVSENKEGLQAQTLNIIDRNNYDRGAAGTSTCGRLALLKAQGLPVLGKTLYNHALSGQHYDGTVLEEISLNGRAAVVPELTAAVYPLGESHFVIDENDPFPEGFVYSM